MKKYFLFLCIIFIFLLKTSYSQWKTNLSLGSTIYNGSKINKFDFITDLNISYKDSIVEYSSFFNANYGEISHNRVNQEFNGGLKCDYLPDKHISPFAVIQAYNNVEKNIDLRLTGLLGVKFALYKKHFDENDPKISTTSEYSISFAGMYETEHYLSGLVPDKENIKISIRPKIRQSLGSNISFEHVTFFKFEIKSPDFFGIYSNTSITSKLMKWLALKISYRIDYDSKLPRTVVEEGQSHYESNVYNVFYTSVVLSF